MGRCWQQQRWCIQQNNRAAPIPSGRKHQGGRQRMLCLQKGTAARWGCRLRRRRHERSMVSTVPKVEPSETALILRRRPESLCPRMSGGGPTGTCGPVPFLVQQPSSRGKSCQVWSERTRHLTTNDAAQWGQLERVRGALCVVGAGSGFLLRYS